MARQDANHDQADRQTLASLCTRPLETGAFLRLAASITAALAPIHKQNIIHANIRPQNIFLDCQTGEVTLSGYCPESRGPWASPLSYSAGASGETLLYMSPEQTGRVKRRVDYRTDFYSLGVTFYQLLTARPIFHGRDAQEYASAISYLGTDIGLLSQDSWEVMYELSLGLHLCKAECEYLSGNLEEADRLISAILPQAGSRADAAEGLSSSLGALDTIAVVNASPQRYESRIIRKDGQVRWVQIFANVIQYMDKPAVQAVFIDITEQKLSEQALRESENRLSQVIDFLPEPTFAIDTDGKLIVWNKAMEELSGYSAKQMVGKANHEYALPFYKGDRCKTLIDLVLNSDEGLEKKYRFI
jgi:PAS domain-containing protein